MVARLYQYKTQTRFLTFREGLILQIDDGFGEIAPLPGFSRETLEEAKKEILSVLTNNTKPTLPSVQFGLSLAQKPFDPSPLKIPFCALNEPRPDCPFLKIKLKNFTINAAIEHVKKFVGKYRLRIDCNRAWDLKEALFFAKHFSATDFEYLEEPVQTFSELFLFSHITNFPIAVDESLRERDCFAIPTLKAAIVKPTLMGFIPKLPIPIVLSSSHESSLGILQIARLGNSPFAQGLDTFSDDLLIPPLRAEKDHLVWDGSKNPLNPSKLCLIADFP